MLDTWQATRAFDVGVAAASGVALALATAEDGATGADVLLATGVDSVVSPCCVPKYQPPMPTTVRAAIAPHKDTTGFDSCGAGCTELLGARDEIGLRDLPELTPRRAPDEESPLERAERETILETLRRTGGDKDAAARELGISRRTLYRRLRDFGPSERG